MEEGQGEAAAGAEPGTPWRHLPGPPGYSHPEAV